MYGLLADLTVEVHLAYLLFAAFGGLLVHRDPRWALPHLTTVSWGIVVVAMQWDCPVTRLEKWLLARGGEPVYDGAFVDRYVFGVYLPDGSQPYAFTAQLLLFAVGYGVWVRTRPGRSAVLSTGGGGPAPG